MSAAPLLTTRRAPRPTAVLAVAAFGAFLAFLDSTIVNVAFPDIAASFPDASIGELSWVLNSYNIVFAAFLVVAGRLADLLGRRRTFVWGVLVFTAASLACALAGSLGQLIAFRVVQGLGAALLVPASLALVVEGFPEQRRAHGIGLWGAAAALAAGTGPPIGGALVASADWRWAFLVNVPLGLLAVVLARRTLVESRAPGRRRVPDLRGALLLAAALGLVTLALVRGHDWGWGSASTLGAAAAGLVAVAGFVLSSRAHPAPLLDPELLRLRSFSWATVLTVVAGAGFYAYLLTHVLFLTYVWDYSLLQAGLAVAPAAFVAAVVAAVLGKVADRRGHRPVVVVGALVWAGSFAWYLGMVGSTPDLLGAWLPGQVLSGIGVGATLPVLGSAALAAVPGGAYATASAVVSSARQLGAVVGIAILVVLVGTPLPGTIEASLRDGWTFSAACFLVVAVGALALRGRPSVADEPHAVTAPEVVPAVLPEQRDPVTADPEPRRTASKGLRDLELFRDVPRTVLRDLERVAEVVVLPAGQQLFCEGDRSDALYVVLRGRLAVSRGGRPGSEVGRGAVLGELGLLTSAPRSASVQGVRDSTLLRLTERQLRAVADAKTWLALARSLACRLQQVEPPRRPPAAAGVIAVVGLDREAPVVEVSRALLGHVRTWLDAADPGTVDAEQLERAEQRHERVLLTAPYAEDADAWRDFCLRACDRVVLVSSTSTPPAVLHPRLRGADLVLTPSARRAEWATALSPRSVHAYDGTWSSLRALGARLAGRSLGLVLGGGGARAFAHLGVLEELERAGLLVDRLAGASVGAAIAALSASGQDAAAVDAHVYEYFVRRNPIGDWTLPTRSLVRGRATLDGLERTFGELAIEELPKEFRCVSVDLLGRSRFVHERGRVAPAVAASLRLPGLYPPLLLDGRLHVDGGVLDNLPVSTLTTQPEGPVIAVSISFGGGGGARSGRTGPPRIPALGDTLMRTLMMSSAAASTQAHAHADVVISPDAAGVGLLEFHQVDRMREQGRLAARAALPAIERVLARGAVPAVDSEAVAS